jgi:hypothetical protein
MFGFVTSMTYENPWMKISQGGTTLGAMKRARLLQDIVVHLGDVCGEEDIGHIAFVAGVPLRDLEKGGVCIARRSPLMVRTSRDVRLLLTTRQ